MGTRLMAKLAAFYTIAELAAISGMSRAKMRRLADSAGIRYVKRGRILLVPLSELVARVPVAWESIVLAERLGASLGKSQAS